MELIPWFSSLTKMQRVLAYVFRFNYRLRRKSVYDGPLTFAEREWSLSIVVQSTQEFHFTDLIKGLKSQSNVTPPSLAQFTPYVDQNNVVRVERRPTSFFFRISWRKTSYIVVMNLTSYRFIDSNYHLSFFHGGPKLILSMLNRNFWIVSGRSAVCRIMFSCIPCIRHKAVYRQPIMADLSIFHVQQNRPFSHVRLDNKGPFIIKQRHRRNARQTKVYFALFACMSMKSVHLKSVSDLTTEAFLTALDRFVAWRGIPSNIYPDCGTNYVGAARQLCVLFCDAKEQQRISAHISYRLGISIRPPLHTSAESGKQG